MFFPPGIGFPKVISRYLFRSEKGRNPFGFLNFSIWKRLNLLPRIAGNLSARLMNILGIITKTHKSFSGGHLLNESFKKSQK